MLPKHGRAGAFPTLTLTVLVLVALAVLMLRPSSAESTTLGESLGPAVVTQPLES